ncbi:DUF1772 domain-containing protein [Rhodobacterales bacterium HKCCSP123]|nr:DUF1772 domain-containing protein [Rhodobacterales bacterium HKCCSP123]
MTWILLVSAILMALVAGVFLSFSDFVMRGLASAPGTSGAAGMVGLNRTVYRSIFMVLLLGFVPVSAALAAMALWQMQGAAQALTLAGALAYLVGVMAVTGRGNVPMNQRLDRLADSPAEVSAYWPRYLRAWTVLNHLRVAASASAALAWGVAAGLA